VKQSNFFKTNPMKMKNRIFTMAILAMGFALNSSAQSDATATATATLITPISISQSVDMDFGTIAASAATGTVVLATDDGRSKTGGATYSGTATAAQFTVTGDGTRTFTISLPSSVVLSNGTDNLTVDNFVSDPSGTGTLVAGAATIKVGATLNLPASAPSGNYTNASDLTVTVNYN
jgi:hypothetical protein